MPDQNNSETENTQNESAAPPSEEMPSGEIMDSMTLDQIKAAGVKVDVPFESGSPRPARLTYAKLPGKPEWTNDSWAPPHKVIEQIRREQAGDFDDDTTA